MWRYYIFENSSKEEELEFSGYVIVPWRIDAHITKSFKHINIKEKCWRVVNSINRKMCVPLPHKNSQRYNLFTRVVSHLLSSSMPLKYFAEPCVAPLWILDKIINASK